MPKQKSQAKKGSSKKVGRDKARCEAYRLSHKHDNHHIKSMLQSNGYSFAKAWCIQHSCLHLLDPIAARQPKGKAKL